MCAKDNICKIKDDWNQIGEKMTNADIIIFGAPNYYGTINALAHACLERTFSFRHCEKLLLKDTLGITVTTRRKNIEINPVKDIIEIFMKSNEMNIIGHADCDEYSQCYTCGYGHDCKIGSVFREHGILDEILPCHLPNEVPCQKNTLDSINNIISILKARNVKFKN